MRDFSAGRDINVEGDVFIHDESIEIGKLFVNCSNEELIEERTHRKSVLSGERKRKFNRLVVAWVVLGLLLTAVSGYLYFIGQTNLSSFLLGGGGIAISLGSIKVMAEPNDFEIRQQSALKEIAYILRERGHR